jgi:hypothetical protein
MHCNGTNGTNGTSGSEGFFSPERLSRNVRDSANFMVGSQFGYNGMNGCGDNFSMGGCDPTNLLARLGGQGFNTNCGINGMNPMLALGMGQQFGNFLVGGITSIASGIFGAVKGLLGFIGIGGK